MDCKTKKGKSIPLQAGRDPEAPRFQDNRRMKVVSVSVLRTGRFTPSKYPWYSFLLGAWGSVVVKVLCYKSEGPGIDSRCRRDFSRGI